MHDPNRIKDHRRRNAGHSAFYAKATADRRLVRQNPNGDGLNDNPDGTRLYIVRSPLATFQTSI